MNIEVVLVGAGVGRGVGGLGGGGGVTLGDRQGAPLKGGGEWVGMYLVGLWFASSSGRGCGVGGWRLVGHL